MTSLQATNSTVLARRRLLIVVQNLPVPFDRRVWQEALALAEAGADVIVVCPADERHPEGRFIIDGITVHRHRAVPEAVRAAGYLREYWLSVHRIRKLVKLVRAEAEVDVIHICNPPDLLFLAAVDVRRSRRRPLIFDQHDLGPELVRAKHMPLNRFFVGVAKLMERVTYRLADHVISTNESYQSIALTRGGKSPDEVTVVRSGPRRAWITEPVRSDAWHAGHQFLIGYVGVMGRQEGITYLLDATQLLVQRGLDVQVALVGSGPDVARLIAYAKDLGVQDNVTFHGRLSDDDLREVLANSDVCVNPDEVNELNNLSTMNKILEYMALGRPIVQFDVQEGRFSAQDASRYARPNDAISLADEIETVLLDPALASEMGEFGRVRFASELCWEAQATQLIRAYVHVLEADV